MQKVKMRYLVLTLLPLLAACGYQPLYGTSGDGARVSQKLSAISVEQQSTRTGQLVRNEIISSIGADRAHNPRYRLSFTTTSNDEDTVTTFGSDVTRKSYQLSVRYKLSDSRSGKVVQKGSTFSHVSYDKTAAPFSDYQAKISAQERAAKEVGNDIRTRLAAFFSSR